ncbi:MAG TPA: hypothetical protein VF450_08330 [Noviherbaspirillum sp.]
MSAFTGNVANSPIYAASSGFAGGAFDNRTVTLWPYSGYYLSSSGIVATRTANLPTAVSHFSLSGNVAGNFALSDWYNRIHISQGLLALGNVVSSVTKTVSVWNAYLEQTQTLNTLTITGGAGIIVTGPGALPITFARNQELQWVFAVGVQGPPTIAATYTWTFADSESVTLAITGSRVTAWALTPDWSQGVRETLQFKTDVMIAWSGAEQRRALRIAPRRQFQFTAPMGQQERRFIEAALFAWSSMVWALPIFSDGQRLTSALLPGALTVACDTVNRDFRAGGLAILITDAAHYEVLQITSVTNTALALTNAVAGSWPVGSRLYPVRTARLVSYPKITRSNSQFATVQPSFVTVEPCDWTPASGLPQYRGYPVLENSPDDSASADASYERESNLIDNDTGVVEMDDTADIGFPTWTHAWFMQGRTQRAFFRSLMYLLKGRQGEIWVPTYQSDLQLAALISSSATTIDVQMTGYTLFLVGQLNRRDIRIELLNGTVFYRRVTGSTGVDANTERLSIDSSLGQQVALSQVRRISFMSLCRLNSDNIDITHENGDTGLATAATPWRASNHDV